MAKKEKLENDILLLENKIKQEVQSKIQAQQKLSDLEKKLLSERQSVTQWKNKYEVIKKQRIETVCIVGNVLPKYIYRKKDMKVRDC